MTAQELTQFWRRCDLEAPPYCHRDDRLAPGRVQQGVASYADYVRAFKDNRLADTALHLSLLPQPYHGDLESAEVIVLLTNPGLHPSDYFAEDVDPEFRQSIIRTIRQEMRSHMFLDPKWAWTSGFTWWEKKLRGVAQIVAREKFKGNYSRALADLARRVACLELVPYHSASYRPTADLASTKAVRRFAQEASRDRTIVVTRAVKDWRISKGPNVISYDAKQARGASLGPNSLGGRAILASYCRYARSSEVSVFSVSHINPA